ncbi:sensor histidine kinase [Streptacidiphilus sp. P02-A3a]|uniref:sensor histidine kinase n=1 Tax=Streptacidiphilus sp. P02-A3a TaxID=2704468 RepID=UPI001CDD4320|nr:sensor histidine kinase [Streptacidiphilus sp. P02-A3a]
MGSSTPADPPGRGTLLWSTRRWLVTGTAAALAVLVVLGALVTWYFSYSTSVTNQLVERSSPALVAAVQLQAALVNEETGTRGYAISGQTDFLQPYTEGLAEETVEVAQLRQLTAGDGAAAADLDLVLARAGTWKHDIARGIVASPPGHPVPAAVAQVDKGKTEFDALRSALTAEQQQLQGRRTVAIADLKHSWALRDWLFTAIALVVLALTVLVFTGLRRGVNAPLEHLSTQLRVVADGDFDHPIVSNGPTDLRQLARDAEAMRHYLVQELANSRAAQAAVDAHAAELVRSNAELEQFAYVASHDLQEPLRKVASFCQLLQRRYAAQLDEKANQYIGFAVDGANRMQTLINDLLVFSRVGRVHDGYAPVDLDQVWASTEDSLSVGIAESGAVLVHDPLPTVDGDATQLGMLLQNLVTNAIKFHAPEQPPRISLACEPDANEDLWRFAFTDNGIGIDPEYAERVFVIFQRLHPRDAYPGNGIGLAMCKKIVEFHGGTIAIDSEYTEGTRIAFTLPRGSATTAEADTDTDTGEQP